MSLYIRKQARAKVRRRIRKKISGTAERPRLAIHFSNQNVYAQLIDDVSGRTIAASFSISPGTDTPVRLLSGGNVQKVLLAREFSTQPKVLIAASPTRGLDVGAIESVRARLVEAADNGVGVLLISEDLEEILSLADRVAVMYEGHIVAVLPASEATRENVGLLMGGASLEATR
jgi:simple sugar transport system ATP-binding protein